MDYQRLHDFIDDNQLVKKLNIAYVNDTATIPKNDKVVSIRSAVEIDLSRPVCADSIDNSLSSGFRA